MRYIMRNLDDRKLNDCLATPEACAHFFSGKLLSVDTKVTKIPHIRHVLSVVNQGESPCVWTYQGQS